MSKIFTEYNVQPCYLYSFQMENILLNATAKTLYLIIPVEPVVRVARVGVRVIAAKVVAGSGVLQ